MADPIIEQLALAVLDEVSTLTTASVDYNTVLCDVVRDTRKGHNPRHLLAVIRQDYGDEAGIEHGQGIPIVTIPVTWIINVYVTPSDRDQTAIDRLLNFAWADVTKALSANWNDGTSPIDTLAYGWSVLAPQAFESGDGSYQGIACRYQSLVRVEENDPYTQR